MSAGSNNKHLMQISAAPPAAATFFPDQSQILHIWCDVHDANHRHVEMRSAKVQSQMISIYVEIAHFMCEDPLKFYYTCNMQLQPQLALYPPYNCVTWDPISTALRTNAPT